MNFPVVIHKDRGTDYGVTVPDLPGCFSAGPTMDKALAMAREAIELHLEGLIDEGQPIPAPAKIEARQNDPNYADGTWALVGIDKSTLRTGANSANPTTARRAGAGGENADGKLD